MAASADNSNRELFIQVRDLHKRLGNQHVLRGLNLDIYRGETLVILGASGEGKSVFLKHLLRLMDPDEGSIVIDGDDIAFLPERQVLPLRRKIGMLFQDGALFDSMNVFDNVAFPLREGGLKNQKEIEDRVHAALEVVELLDAKEKMPVHLSGGMRKRVALARAAIGKPQCILYDEPTAGLDPVVSDSINRLIRHLQHTFKITSIVVTHDMKSAYHIADRVAYLRKGEIYFLGSVDELKNTKDEFLQNFINGVAIEHEQPQL